MNDLRKMTTLSGEVVTGRGYAGVHITGFVDELACKTGQRLFSGSLNVVLDGEVRFRLEKAQAFDNHTRFLWPACIGATPVWLYRWRGAPLHIVEILSEHKLRNLLGLEDGGKITIEVDSSIVDKLRFRDRVSSFLIWGLGRKSLYYRGTYASRNLVSLFRKYTKDGQW